MFYKHPFSIYRRLTSNLLVTKWKSMVAFKSVIFIVLRTINIEKSFSNMQVVFIENVSTNVSYSIPQS